MQEIKPSLKFIFKISIIVILYLLFSIGKISADESQIQIIGNTINAERLAVSFQAQNFLTEKAIEFLNKGFTLQINYTIELWKSRSFWFFDKPLTQKKIEHIIRYDIFRKEYSCLQKIEEEISEKTVFKIERIVDFTTKFMNIEMADIKNLQNKSDYYYSINAELKMLTADELKDLQRWFRELESEREESKSNSLSDIFMRIITDFFVSQKVEKLRTESEKFRIER